MDTTSSMNRSVSALPRTKSRTGSSSPDSSRSSSTQCGLGRNRQSKTRSTSRGMPNLYPNDRIAVRIIGAPVVASNSSAIAATQLVGGEVAGLEQDVGRPAQLAERLALLCDREGDRGRRHGVAPPRALVAADEHVVGRVEEQDLDPGALRAQVLDHRDQLGDLGHPAAADHDG